MNTRIFALILLIFASIQADELRDLTNKGMKAYKKGDFESAVQYFTTALEKSPTSPVARFNKGIALAANGKANEAEITLSAAKFDGNDKKSDNFNAKVLYSRARIAEGVGDAAISNQQQPNIAEAKKSYEQARKLYADALDLQWDKKEIRKIVNNIEILSQKIKSLPDVPESENKNDKKNEDNSEQNKDNNKNKDDSESENKDNNENKDDSESENKDDKEKKDDSEQNQSRNKENEEQNEQNKDDNEQSEQKPNENERQNDEEVQDAIMLLDHYADDAKELNRPPKQKAIPAENGKDW